MDPKEILILDNDVLKVYRYNETSRNIYFVDSKSFGVGGKRRHSNIEVMDMDGDGYVEFMMYDASNENFSIFNFSNNIINLERSYIVTFSGPNIADPVIHCPVTNECLIVATDVGRTEIYDTFINYVGTHTPRDSVAGSSSLVFPNINKIEYGAYDTGGVMSYVYIWGREVTGGVYLKELHWNGTHTTTHPTETITLQYDPSGVTDMGKFEITAPLMGDYTSDPGLEVVVGVVTDTTSDTDFQLFLYGKGEGLIRTFPDVYEGDGYFISNPFEANAFPGSDFTDVCVMSYDDTSPEHATILCGNDGEGGFLGVYGSREYIKDIDLASVRSEQNFYNNMAHAIESEVGNGLSEVLTAYGVFSLIDYCDYTILYGNICEMDFIYSFVEGPQINVIPIDYNDDGYDDIFGLTNVSLFYYEDLRVNSPVNIIDYSTDPDIKQLIEENSSFWVSVRLRDPDGDNYSVRVFLYYDHYNEQTLGWFNYSSQDTYQAFFNDGFNLSTSGTMRIEAFDQGNGDLITETETFSVSPLGIVTYGDGSSHEGGGDDDDDDPDGPGELTDEEQEELLSAIMPGIAEEWRLLFSLLIMILSGLAFIWYLSVEMNIRSDSLLLYGPMGLVATEWIFFVVFGVIPAWTIIIAILLGAGIIGFKFFPRQAGV